MRSTVRLPPLRRDGLTRGGRRLGCYSDKPIVFYRQEVRPMNAVSVSGAPLQVTIALR